MGIYIPIILAGITALIALFVFVLPRFSSNRKGLELMRNQQYDEALTEFLRAVDKNPQDFRSRYYLALIYAKKKNIDLARKHLQDLLNANRFNDEVERNDVLLKMASLNLELGLDEQAFQNFQEVLDLDPGNRNALFQLGYLAVGQSEFEIAHDFFKKFLAVDKKDFEALFADAVCLNKIGQGSEAEKTFVRALKSNPESKLTRLLYGVQLLLNEKYSNALKELRILLDDKSTPHVVYFIKRTTALLLYKNQRSLEAVRMLEELKRYCKQNELGKQIPPLLYDLAMIFLSLHDWSFASAYLTMVEYFDADYNDVHMALQNLEYIYSGDETSERELINIVQTWENNRTKQFDLFALSGLRSGKKFNITSFMPTAKGAVAVNRGKGEIELEEDDQVSAGSNWDELFKLSFNDFERLVYHISKSIDLSVTTRLNTYREQDGIDLLCKEKNSGENVLVVFRRWKQSKLGDIELRNIVDYIKNERIKRAYLMITTGLTDGAKATSESIPEIKIYSHEELVSLIEQV